jgi:hypothetical protein
MDDSWTWCLDIRYGDKCELCGGYLRLHKPHVIEFQKKKYCVPCVLTLGCKAIERDRVQESYRPFGALFP